MANMYATLGFVARLLMNFVQVIHANISTDMNQVEVLTPGEEAVSEAAGHARCGVRSPCRYSLDGGVLLLCELDSNRR